MRCERARADATMHIALYHRPFVSRSVHHAERVLPRRGSFVCYPIAL